LDGICDFCLLFHPRKDEIGERDAFSILLWEFSLVELLGWSVGGIFEFDFVESECVESEFCFCCVDYYSRKLLLLYHGIIFC